MKQVTDQARLLFLAVLNSTATALVSSKGRWALPSLASLIPASASASSAFSVSYNSNSNEDAPRPTQLRLRLATKWDIPGIQQCNLKNLPENYSTQFYMAHLQKWPDLSLVAEQVRMKDDEEDLSPPLPRSLWQRQPQNKPEIVGYLLGKVEKRRYYGKHTNPYATEKDALPMRVQALGHVTSLAVQPDFRRLGIGKALMQQLHLHLEHEHGVEECGLHVRAKTNPVACQLYQEDGYRIQSLIPSYYMDGEDALLMQKRIATRKRNSWLASPIWKSGPQEMRLPRWLPPPSESLPPPPVYKAATVARPTPWQQRRLRRQQGLEQPRRMFRVARS